MIRVLATHWVAAHRKSWPFRFTARAASVYQEMYENFNYEFASNGEAWLLNRLSRTQPRVIFDVGANIGDWTATAVAAIPGAQIHAFELVPSTALHLRTRFADAPRVRVVPAGLLDDPGTVRVKYYPEFSAASSIHDFPHPLEYQWIDAPAIRGDDYCREAGVRHVDFIKIDAEGADHRVLQGFSRMLEAGAVDALQFEYGRTAITNHFLLSDFYVFLENHGMVVGKLFPNHVDFRGYDIHRDENFLGPNYVAVRRAHPDLLRVLSGL